MKAQGNRPVAGYIRVSRIGGRSGEGYISPDEQRIHIDRYAQELGVQIEPDGWVEDQDYSGGNFDRPGWESIIERIEAGALGGVIVLRVDRFARNVPDGAAQIRHVVKECGAIFASAQERMDPSTDTGLYMLQQFLNNAELQLNMIKAGWKTAKERAINRGAHIGKTPVGYGRTPKGQERSGVLFPLPEWRPIIAALFRYAASKKTGDREIANFMNARYPRPDGQRWIDSTVGRIIANRVYLGEVAYRPREGNSDFPPLVNCEAHEPMTNEATWLEAQRAPSRKQSSARGTNLLAGLMRCSACRYRMTTGRGGDKVRVYRCKRDHGAGVCRAPALITASRIEEFVLREVQDQWEARFSVSLKEPGRSVDADDIATRLADARRERDVFACDLKARRLLGDSYHPALEARTQAVSAIEAEWSALERDREQVAGSEISWSSLEHGELRELLVGALDAVYVRRGRGVAAEDRSYLVWAGELDDDVPARGAANVIRPFEWPEDDGAGVGVAAA